MNGGCMMNNTIIDKSKLEQFPKVVLDGQNIAFRHGEKIAQNLNRSKFFSYEGLKLAFEALYRRGFKAEIVMPSFQLKKRRTNQYDKTGVVKYLNEFNVFVEVKGYNSNKRDDLFILQHAFNTNSSIISNDQYRNKLEQLSESEYKIWKPWLDKNRYSFEFVNDSLIVDSDNFSLGHTTNNEPLENSSNVLAKKEEEIIPKMRHIRKPVPRPVLTYGDFKAIISDLFRVKSEVWTNRRR